MMKYPQKVALLIFLIWITMPMDTNVNIPSKEAYQPFFSYVNSSQIVILNDLNFTDYGFQGDGTLANPFRIQNLNITTTADKGIYICNTTKHFIIQDSFVTADNFGISIESVKNETVKIENTICVENTKQGIRIVNSSHSIIYNNTCYSNGYYGVYLRDSPNCLIELNTCFDNSWVGIFLDKSSESIVINNTCYENRKGGMVLDDCENSLISHNLCYLNDFIGGLRLLRCYSSTVSDNTCYDNFQSNLYILRSNFSLVARNICYGKSYAIVVISGGNVNISDNICTNSDTGMYLKDAEYSIINNNMLYDCGFTIYESTVEDFRTYYVTSNYVNDKLFGYFVDENDLSLSEAIFNQLLLVNCSDSKIENQHLSSFSTGLALYYCEDISISNSFFLFNRKSGLHLFNSDGVSIFNNTYDYNEVYGILLESSSYNQITFNLIENSGLWGLVLDDSSSNNMIHHNSFINNNVGGTSQAMDDGDNIWYDENKEEGNYWEDYSGVGSYSIDGSADAEDPYPLSEPPVYRNNNIYYAFLSLIVFIPLIAYSYFRFSSKRKR